MSQDKVDGLILLQPATNIHLCHIVQRTKYSDSCCATRSNLFCRLSRVSTRLRYEPAYAVDRSILILASLVPTQPIPFLAHQRWTNYDPSSKGHRCPRSHHRGDIAQSLPLSSQTLIEQHQRPPPTGPSRPSTIIPRFESLPSRQGSQHSIGRVLPRKTSRGLCPRPRSSSGP